MVKQIDALRDKLLNRGVRFADYAPMYGEPVDFDRFDAKVRTRLIELVKAGELDAFAALYVDALGFYLNHIDPPRYMRSFYGYVEKKAQDGAWTAFPFTMLPFSDLEVQVRIMPSLPPFFPFAVAIESADTKTLNDPFLHDPRYGLYIHIEPESELWGWLHSEDLPLSLRCRVYRSAFTPTLLIPDKYSLTDSLLPFMLEKLRTAWGYYRGIFD